MQHAVRLDKDNSLAALINNPQDEVRIKATLFKKANAVLAAQIPQQEGFFADESPILFRIPEISQVTHKLGLAGMQPRGEYPGLVLHFHQAACGSRYTRR